MKTTGQSIPPEMADAYNKIVSTNAAAPGGVFTLRTSKKVKLTKRQKPINRMLRACYEAVDKLIEYKQSSGGWTATAGFRTAEAKRLYAGQFDSQYWTVCGIDSVQTFISYPGSDPFVGPRNYAYPDPTNQPTKAVYTSSSASTGAPRYSGSTSSGYFRDDELAWERFVINLNNPCYKDDGEPLLITISATISASANLRPSKAMLSWIIKIYVVNDSDPKVTTDEPPTTQPIINYFRYITPRGEPPFFSYATERRAMYNGRRPKGEATATQLQKLVILIAPMPMMGKRYNNNTQVDTNLSDIQINAYQISKTVYPKWNTSAITGTPSLSNDDRTVTVSGIYDDLAIEANTRISEGRWYWEVIIDHLPAIANGRIKIGMRNQPGLNGGYTDVFEWSANQAEKIYWAQDWEYTGSYSSAANSGDVIGVAVDLVEGKISLYKNGVFQGVMWAFMEDMELYEQTPIHGNFAPYVSMVTSNAGDLPQVTANFGQQAFAYPVPEGYNAGVY